MRFILAKIALLSCASLLAGQSMAQVEVRIAKQLQINDIPTIVMEQQQLFEKHALTAGLKDAHIKWMTFANGGATIDALISGNVDYVMAGLSNFAILWSRTQGKVKGVAAVAGLPLPLLTRNPNVKSLKDFTDQDRIAVPTVKVSNQAVMLSMALEREYGEKGRTKLDAQTVQLAHSDAVQALLNPKHEVNSHFSSSPYAEMELKAPGVHEVLDTADLTDGALTNNIMFTTPAVYGKDPRVVQALVAALKEADAFITAHPRETADLYLKASGDRLTTDEVVAVLTQRGAIFTTTPRNTQEVVKFMARAGLIKNSPEKWQDLYFPSAQEAGGS